jgi:hypothetical protein
MAEYGDAWTYESIVGALPGFEVSPRTAIAVQVVVFEGAVLSLAWYYDLWSVAAAGTVAVAVATLGSAEMLRIGATIRGADTPAAYRRLLFGSSVEVVLSVLAFVALVTYLVGLAPESSLSPVFAPDAPLPVVYLTLLVLWDLCYRIGTGWWASIVGLWRSARYRFDADTAATLRRADAETVRFGLAQLLLIPFVLEQPLLVAALVGHVLAVVVVSGTSMLLLWLRDHPPATASV